MAGTFFEDSSGYPDCIVTAPCLKRKRKAQRLTMKSFPEAFALLCPTPLRGKCGQDCPVPTASCVSPHSAENAIVSVIKKQILLGIHSLRASAFPSICNLCPSSPFTSSKVNNP